MSDAAGIVAAQKMHAERRMIEALRAAQAFSPQRAIPLAADRNLSRLALRGLLRQNAIRQATPGHYYLDEAAYAGVRKTRQRLAIGLLVIGLVFGVALVIALSGAGVQG